MNGVSLSETALEKDLGVWTDSSWKPGSQCDAAAKKANAMLGQIARKFHYRKKATLIPLYKTFVRPHLEYAVAAWSPWTVKDIETRKSPKTLRQTAIRR
jgi:ribonuclease P/MRP protein subunit RPP40